MELAIFLEILLKGSIETLYMVSVATLASYILGVPIGIVLYITDKGSICQNGFVNKVLGFVVNFLRSVPFLILLIAVLPFTRLVTGTTIGATATIVPLVIGAAPFVGRMVESSLKEVDLGIIEAANSMGASPLNIIFKVLLPEAKPSLIVGSTIATTTILGYSALAGFTGGGGLGTIAVNYGFYRYNDDIMNITVLLIVVIVQIVQEVGMKISKLSDKRN